MLAFFLFLYASYLFIGAAISVEKKRKLLFSWAWVIVLKPLFEEYSYYEE